MGIKESEYKRMAGRTPEEFKLAIKKGHLEEREVVDRYADFYRNTTGRELDIIDNGVDNSGEYLDIKDVNKDADFLINGKLVEIKIIRKNLFQFRLKLELIESYIEQKAIVLLVNGFETDEPQFTFLDEDELYHMATFSKKEISSDWEGKPTVLVYRNSFDWQDLPKLSVDKS